MTKTTQTIKQRLGRWHSFVEGGEGSFMFHMSFRLLNDKALAELPPPPPFWPDKVQQRISYQWSQYEIMCKKAEIVDDDRVPYLNNFTGTEIFAEAFGCEVHRPEDNMPFALPFVRSAAEADKITVPDLSTSSLAYLFDIADELYRRGGPEAIMKLVDVQSPMDIVALIWEKADLFCAMIESPEAVKCLADKVRELLVSFFDEWFTRYGTTFISHFPDYVMHGGITMSVDEVGAINPEMFQEFFRDELIALSDHFGGLGIHCCADARHQWENFRELPGLKVMNHNAPPTRDARQYLLDMVRFYGDRVATVPVGWVPEGSPDTWPAQFPEGTRVVFEVPAENAASAASIASQLQELREEIKSCN